MSASSVSQLPDLVLITIFDELPLHFVLHIDEVCRAWGGKLKSGALVRRKQLIIVQDKKDLEALEVPPYSDCDLLRLVKEDDGSPYRGLRLGLDHHALILKDLITLPTMTTIGDMMPNLTTLWIVQTGANFSMLLSISSLLDRYRHKLTELTVKVSFDEILPEDVDKKNEAQTAASNFFNLFCQSLNSLTALTSLELSLNAGRCSSAIQLPLAILANAPDLAAIIGRVKSLYLRLNCFGENPDYRKSKALLCPYIEANKHLNSFYCLNMDDICLRKIIKKGGVSPHRPRVTAAWQKVSIHELMLTKEADTLETLLPQYSSLLELNVYLQIDYSAMSHLIRTLAISGACHSLVYLNIWGIYFHLEEDRYPSKYHLPVLPSVKVLSLNEFSPLSHRMIERMHLPIIFPNIQVIELEHYYTLCRFCDYHLDLERHDGNSRKKIRRRRALVRTIHNCLRQSRLCFDRFAKLTRLEVNYVYYSWDFDPENFSPSLNRHWSFTKENLDQDTLLPSETDGWEVDESDDEEDDESDSDMTIDDE